VLYLQGNICIIGGYLGLAWGADDFLRGGKMKYDTISTVWAKLKNDAKIIIVTEACKWELAEKIKSDNAPLVADIELIDIAKDKYKHRIEALSESDLLIVLLSIDGFIVKNYRDSFSPFSKPAGVKSKYIFIRLDIPEQALLSGLSTDIDEIEKRIAELSILQKNTRVRVTTEKGTDLIVCVDDQETLPYHARDLGGNAFLPPSEVSEELIPGETNGIIVVDITVGEFRVNGELVDALGIVDEPVTVKIEKGFVKEVSGGALAARLKRCFSALPKSHHFTVELGHGLSDIEPTGIIGVDESMNGTCHIGIGDRTLYHLDLVIGSPKITVL
jgi:hypothetical protein